MNQQDCRFRPALIVFLMAGAFVGPVGALNIRSDFDHDCDVDDHDFSCQVGV